MVTEEEDFQDIFWSILSVWDHRVRKLIPILYIMNTANNDKLPWIYFREIETHKQKDSAGTKSSEETGAVCLQKCDVMCCEWQILPPVSLRMENSVFFSQDSLGKSTQGELWQLAAAEPQPLQPVHGQQSTGQLQIHHAVWLHDKSERQENEGQTMTSLV